MEEEEIVEMGEGKDGVFHPVAVVKKNETRHPQAIPPHIPRRTAALMEIIDGFVMGLGAIEHFMNNVSRFGNKRRNPNGKHQGRGQGTV